MTNHGNLSRRGRKFYHNEAATAVSVGRPGLARMYVSQQNHKTRSESDRYTCSCYAETQERDTKNLVKLTSQQAISTASTTNLALTKIFWRALQSLITGGDGVRFGGSLWEASSTRTGMIRICSAKAIFPSKCGIAGWIPGQTRHTRSGAWRARPAFRWWK